MVAPELKVRSDWERHALTADIKGSYIAYSETFGTNDDGTPSGSPNSLDRPTLDSRVDGRIDVNRLSHIDLEGRLLLGTDNPGSPNIQAGLARLPIVTTVGTTLGYTQAFNRFEVTAKGTVDRSVWQASTLTDGTVSDNDDRNFNQYGGSLRVGYELKPGLKPFAEVGADTRVHDLTFDRNGERRDSDGVYAKVGTTFEITRKLTGEVSVGYLDRHYTDPRLQDLQGVLLDASLKWEATGLTTATLTAASRGDEVVVPGWSGALRRDIGVQVDHALRRWLIWTVRAGYGFDDYVGSDRADKRMSIGSALTYKFNRELSLKGEYRYDQLRSNASGVNYNANVFLIGLKWQR
jgi:hypothetical protein